MTGRAVNPQNVPLFIIFQAYGKPSKKDPAIPVSGRLKPELELYAKRVRVLWDPKALLEVLFPRILSQPCLRVFMTCDHKIIFPVIFD